VVTHLLVALFHPAAHRESAIFCGGLVFERTAHQARGVRAFANAGLAFRESSATVIKSVEVKGTLQSSDDGLQTGQPCTTVVSVKVERMGMGDLQAHTAAVDAQ
jgi:hypothetical protein